MFQQYLKENGKDDIKGFLTFILWFQVCFASHSQITQNNKFAISLQYPKKQLSDRVDVLHADKHKSVLQIDTLILIGMVKHSQSSQMTSLQCLYNISRKEVRDEVGFSMQINIKFFFHKLILTRKFHLKTPRVEKAFCMTSIFQEDIPSQVSIKENV